MADLIEPIDLAPVAGGEPGESRPSAAHKRQQEQRRALTYLHDAGFAKIASALAMLDTEARGGGGSGAKGRVELRRSPEPVGIGPADERWRIAVTLCAGDPAILVELHARRATDSNLPQR